MSQKKHYSRQYMRQYYANQCYISIDGEHVERDYMNKETGNIETYYPSIYQDCNTYERYVEINKVRVNIAEMVLTCYGGAKPRHDVSYIVHHKDGEFCNDNLRNLEWIEDTAANRAMIKAEIEAYHQQKKMKWYKRMKIKAKKTGEIKQNGYELSPYYHFFDADIDWFVYLDVVRVKYTFKNRYGNYSSDTLYIEDILDDFGFIKGDKKQFSNPAVLHIDNDFLNFHTDNLEWCDATDPRYIDYDEKRSIKSMELEIEANRHLIDKGISAPGFKERYADVLDKASIKIPH